jgi:hypothetical protein
MTTYNNESHGSVTMSDEVFTTTTMYDESMGSVTMSDEYMGFPIMCDNTDILCNSVEYDCEGARIMHAWAHTTTTYYDEVFS